MAQHEAWEHNSEWTTGIVKNPEGTYTALTLSASKTFKTRKGAEKWMDKMGYRPDGSKR